MRISEIIELLKEYVLLGVVAIALFIVGYKIIYQKLMKGTKTISKPKLVLYGISICYILVVKGATFLNRGAGYGTINLHLFSSYKQAYNQMQISLFRNIILNILLFVPLGFLLPFYSDKLKKSYITVGIGFVTTLIIEILQYVTRIGIFEIDDILNNTVRMSYRILRIYDLQIFMDKRKKKDDCSLCIAYDNNCIFFFSHIHKIRKSRTWKSTIWIQL